MSAQNLKYGVYGGLAGGVVFGVMMGMMGMLPMIGQMVGSPSSVVGFVIHMVNSAIIGAAFDVVFGSVVAGMGVVWSLTLMQPPSFPPSRYEGRSFDGCSLIP